MSAAISNLKELMNYTGLTETSEVTSLTMMIMDENGEDLAGTVMENVGNTVDAVEILDAFVNPASTVVKAVLRSTEGSWTFIYA